jgi:YidC/Oxa1 family membrane protein insertase
MKKISGKTVAGVNKNTTLAFILILATVVIFTPFLKQPTPDNTVKSKKTDDSTLSEKNSIPHENSEINKSDVKKPEESIVVKHANTTLGKWDTIWVETEKIIAGISELGAKLVSLKMKEYPLICTSGTGTDSTNKPGDYYVELIARESPGGACMIINNTQYDDMIFSVEGNKTGERRILKKGDQTEVSFVTADSLGNKTKKQFCFKSDGYIIGLKIINSLLNNSRLTLSWPAGIVETEKKSGLYQIEQRAAHFSDENIVEHLKSGKPLKEEKSGFYRWVGVSSKYFFEAIVADTIKDADIKIIAFDDNKETGKDGKKSKSNKINYSISYQYSVQGNETSCWFYTGPAKFFELKKHKIQFQKIMFPVYPWNILGISIIPIWADSWFPPITEFVLWLLLVLYGLVKDYGVAILLLTILTLVVTFPLTQSSMKSMSRMKDLQPKINAIRQKHKSNPSKMNQEIMALYKKEGVNPLNPGCLPMFLQMPVFIALFVVLQKAIELRGASTVLIPWVHDLSLPEALFSFEKIIPTGIPLYGSNFAVLPIIMAVLTFFQNKMTIKDPNQKMMIYFMPIFMLVLFNNFASGLVLYWTSSSALRLIQQYYTEKMRNKSLVQQKTPPLSNTKR